MQLTIIIVANNPPDNIANAVIKSCKKQNINPTIHKLAPNSPSPPTAFLTETKEAKAQGVIWCAKATDNCKLEFIEHSAKFLIHHRTEPTKPFRLVMLTPHEQPSLELRKRTIVEQAIQRLNIEKAEVFEGFSVRPGRVTGSFWMSLLQETIYPGRFAVSAIDLVCSGGKNWGLDPSEEERDDWIIERKQLKELGRLLLERRNKATSRK